MIKYIEQLLYEKTKDTQSEILYTQWSYDKKVIPEILKIISNLFPHYSLHDESHSISIINNIVRVLGKENINGVALIIANQNILINSLALQKAKDSSEIKNIVKLLK